MNDADLRAYILANQERVAALFIGGTTAAVLRALVRKGAASSLELADGCGISKDHANICLKELVAKGYATREQVHAPRGRFNAMHKGYLYHACL